MEGRRGGGRLQGEQLQGQRLQVGGEEVSGGSRCWGRGTSDGEQGMGDQAACLTPPTIAGGRDTFKATHQ